MVLGALALSWSGQSAAVAPLLGKSMAVAFAATVDLAAVLALHEAVSSAVASVRRWSWSVLICAGGTSLGLNVYHAIHSGLLPIPVAVAVGTVPVLIAGQLSHVVALSGGPAPKAAAEPAPEPRPEPPGHVAHQPRPEPRTSAPGEPPAGTRREPLRVVPEPRRPGRPTTAADGSRSTLRAPVSHPDGEARMAEHWQIETAKGNTPSGAELARVGGVSRATGKRRAADFREAAGMATEEADSAHGDQVAENAAADPGQR